MIVTRFCSKEELQKFLNGEILINTTDHYRGGKGGSLSRGFCFTADDPATAWQYLKGIVTPEVCMILDIHPANLRKSSGRYSDYSDGIGLNSCIKTEYCTMKYSNHSAKLIRALDIQEFATPEECAIFAALSKNRI